MGIYFVSSDELLDLWTHDTRSGWTTSTSSLYLHGGDYVWVWTGAGTSTTYPAMTLITSAPSEMWMTMYITVAQRPTNTTEIMHFGTNAYLRIENGGALHIRDDNAATSSSSTSVLSLNTIYKLWIHINNTTNVFEIKLDNGPVITHTYASAAGNPILVLGNGGVSNATQPVIAFDDIVASDTPMTDGFYIRRLSPNGNGSNTAWTGTYTDIDENPADDDSTYITTSAGLSESWTLNDPSLEDNISCLVSVYLARCTSGTATLRLTLTSNSNVDVTVNTTYAYYAVYINKNSSSVALNKTDVFAYEQGVTSLGGTTHRVSYACLLAVYPASRTTDRNNLLIGV